MILYIAIFAVVVAIYFGTRGGEAARSKGLLFAIVLFLGLFVGLSDMLGGYDRYIYGNLFDGLCDDVSLGYPVEETSLRLLYPSEFGYGYINYAISFITHNRYIFILIYTLIVYALLFRSISRYASNYPFAVIVFMGLWFFFTFTYLRQVLAAAVCWLAIEYAVKRKPLPFFAIVFTAFTIHNSAVVFMPLYFIPVKKYPPAVVIAAMVACLAIGMSGLPASVFESYGEITDTEKRMAGMDEANSAGFRPEYLLEAVVFLTLIFMRYRDLDSRDRMNVMLTNMAFIFCGTLLVFVQSENGGRLGWFYLMGVICSLTNLCNKEKSLGVIGSVVLVMSTALYLRIAIGWGILVNPYKTFLTDGYREGDKIHEVYEYDSNYDVDKFYR